MPPKLYCSPSFENRMRWRAGRAPANEILAAVTLVASRSATPPIPTTDARGEAVEIAVDGLDAFYSVIALFSCQPTTPVGIRLGTFLKRL